MALPVILDTDIGLDVDDVWALGFLLKCPELDVRLVLTSTGDTRHAASLAGKLLEVAGRTEVPVGIGIEVDPDLPKTHAAWVGDYDISDYPGPWYEDGIQALIDAVRGSDEELTILVIGPTRNLAVALEQAPEITQRVRLIGMLGSLRRGYLGADKPMREYNVFKDPQSARAVLEANWEKTLVPLDTCGTIALDGARFQRLRDSDDPLVKAILENHFGWAEAVRNWPMMKNFDATSTSSKLYDTLPVYLAFASEWVRLDLETVKVTEDGWTRADPTGARMLAATEWRDQAAFHDFLVDRLLSGRR